MRKSKSLLFTFAVLIVLNSCTLGGQPLNNAFLGMTVGELQEMAHNEATLDVVQNNITVYRYNWADPGSSLRWNTTFYYFKDGKLVEINQGVRQSNNNTQLRLNYNLN